jgi:hypothetical protein
VATSIADTGAITIEDNAFICQISVDAFVTAQLAAGWADSLSTANNTGSGAP